MASRVRAVALVTAVLALSMGQTELAARGRAGQRAVAEKGTPTTGSGAAVAERRLAHLRHGINVSDWFAQVGDASGYTKQHFDTAITPHDMDLIQAMGFDHVRLTGLRLKPISLRRRDHRSLLRGVPQRAGP